MLVRLSNCSRLSFGTLLIILALGPARYLAQAQDPTASCEIEKWGIHLTQVAPRRCGLVDPWRVRNP